MCYDKIWYDSDPVSGTFLMGQDTHGGVVFQLADEHDAADGGCNVDGAETPLQALHSSGLVQMPNQ